MTTLRQAAQALCDRWDTSAWKDAPHTAVFVRELKMALASEEAQTVEPVGFVLMPLDPPSSMSVVAEYALTQTAKSLNRHNVFRNVYRAVIASYLNGRQK